MDLKLRRNCAIALLVGFLHPGCTVGSRSDPALVRSTYFAAAPQAEHSQKLDHHPHFAFTQPQSTPREIRVMSFNLRIPIFIDGPNHWNFRRKLVLQTIGSFAPDLLGTQECLLSQANFLREHLTEYAFVGAGRNDGEQRGEMCAVFFRRDRFEKLAEGHFWLSKTPQIPGSKSWGGATPRMVTWVKLRDRADGLVFCFFNTHFDPWRSHAREQAALLLRRKIDEIAGPLPVVLTGDFNADEDSTPYQTIIAGQRTGDPRFTDTLRAANLPADLSDDGTRHGFRGTRRGPRIDWIVTDASFQTLDASINYSGAGLRYPSDHFPVTAVIRPVASASVARVE